MDVSFAVASFNSGQFLEECIDSALAQQDVTCEVLIVDDGSSDGSDQLAQRLAGNDPRVRFFRTPDNRGPGGARNIALENMRGDWFAVLDSDDLVEPQRSARLIAAAKARGADMVADDMVLFGEGMPEARLLEHSDLAGKIISIGDYFRDSAMYGTRANPGFLKPMISRNLIEGSGVRYDERLRVAEDDDLIIRLLMAGARYLIVPEAGYRYRKHAHSISHRLSPRHAEAMGVRAKELEQEVLAAQLDSSSFHKRQTAMRRAVAFTHTVEALKQGNLVEAAKLVLSEPGSLRLFSMPLKARMARIFRQ